MEAWTSTCMALVRGTSISGLDFLITKQATTSYDTLRGFTKTYTYIQKHATKICCRTQHTKFLGLV